MKMREIYEEKQRRWEAFRTAEGQRRLDQARQAELDRLAEIMAESRARREYTQLKFRQTLSVRSHHHAAIVIQRAFRETQSRRWWQERVEARVQFERRSRENRAAVKIQRAWRVYRQHKIYRSTHFKAVYTSPVVALPHPAGQGRYSPAWTGEGPSYKRYTTITGLRVKTKHSCVLVQLQTFSGSPRRKMHQTLLGGFRVPRPTLHSPQTLHPLPTHRRAPMSVHSHHFPVRTKKQRTSTSPVVRLSPRSGPMMNTESLSELFARVSLLKKTKPSTSPTKPAPFHLPQIVPH